MDGVLSRLIFSVKISKVEVQLQDVPAARTFESKERHTSVTPEDLSERWSIGLGQSSKRDLEAHNTENSEVGRHAAREKISC